ncbi:DNA/RNA non-specific endonuclease [Cellulophaga sp. F20128]|uniref:DNA/RNA non-specific endonuclease n=1 Tax=Cellulophaga sp. F20128 TaxID=2926413 RepID=UPI001FF13F3B|nr:DNA/RNA non-specific endonuclease [Cellulophaga sp. F20128]MCK0157346.1 DNA/RNA non-specific endonuclease [Cellulophaga sp. F20128]
MNKKKVFTILSILCIIGFWLFENFYTPALYTAPAAKGSTTDIASYLKASSTTGDVVSHNHYTLSYNEQYEQAEWVAYVLKKEHLTYDDRKRPYFIEDPKVKTKSADWRNYKGSGFDRGHLCPAGDRRFSEYAYNETFYTSNITPQKNDFNAGIWNKLEIQVRTWAKKEKEIYVITGGILEKGLEEIGEEDVAVPNYFYKIVAKGTPNNLKVAAFLFPHKESTKSLVSFMVSVDRIEKLTGIDFFENLAEERETILEKKVDTNSWKF